MKLPDIRRWTTNAGRVLLVARGDAYQVECFECSAFELEELVVAIQELLDGLPPAAVDPAAAIERGE